MTSVFVYSEPMSRVGELVVSAQAGDKAAWTELVHEFETLVWRTARSYRLNEADAHDVCQTAWLKAATKLHTLRDPDRFAGWITTIVDREALNTLRRRQREVPSSTLHSFETESSPDHAHEPVEAQELAGRIRAAFLQLSEQCRNIITLRTTEPPTPYAQIAELLGVPVGSIGSYRQRCLASLRVLVGEFA